MICILTLSIRRKHNYVESKSNRNWQRLLLCKDGEIGEISFVILSFGTIERPHQSATRKQECELLQQMLELVPAHPGDGGADGQHPALRDDARHNTKENLASFFDEVWQQHKLEINKLEYRSMKLNQVSFNNIGGRGCLVPWGACAEPKLTPGGSVLGPLNMAMFVPLAPLGVGLCVL